MEILVGATGFVGSNIAAVHNFDILCNSKNVSEAFGTNPDLLVYAGVPAEMFLANHNPEADKALIHTAVNNIRRINPKRLVLISTVAVMNNPVNADEDTVIDGNQLPAYGRNRLGLEKAVSEIADPCHIIRLPALFGMGIRKNFLYDMMNFLPALLSKAKFDEFSAKEPLIAANYIARDEDFYKLCVVESERKELKAAFERIGFSAIHFTDSRSIFQFYNLSYLWNHIEVVMDHHIPLLHAATEPLSAAEVYESVFGRQFRNELNKPPFYYDFRTQYAELFGGKNGYLFDRGQVKKEIQSFVGRGI